MSVKGELLFFVLFGTATRVAVQAIVFSGKNSDCCATPKILLFFSVETSLWVLLSRLVDLEIIKKKFLKLGYMRSLPANKLFVKARIHVIF